MQLMLSCRLQKVHGHFRRCVKDADSLFLSISHRKIGATLSKTAIGSMSTARSTPTAGSGDDSVAETASELSGTVQSTLSLSSGDGLNVGNRDAGDGKDPTGESQQLRPQKMRTY
jgi:hypothetical protein